MRGPPVGAVLLALVLLAAPLLSVTLVVGGPPAEEAEGGGTIWAPRLESWSLVAAAPSSRGGGLLCTDEAPCDPNATRENVERGHPCAWTGRVWLTTGPLASAFPVVLLEPEVLVYAVIEGGDGRQLPDDRVNFSHHSAEFPLEWDEDAWWRMESQRVHVTVPLPCDARLVDLHLNVRGHGLTGKEYEGAQSVDARLWET